MVITTRLDIDDIKYLEDVDEHGGGDDAKGRADQWDRDLPEHVPAARAVDFSRLYDFVGDTFESGRDDHHAKACPHPHINPDQPEDIYGSFTKPPLRVTSQQHPHHPDQH